jgi:hypothetical protein
MAENENRAIKKWGIIGLMIVVLLWSANFLMLFVSDDDRGIFGDMFGAVNALFSGLAFAGIIITILMQRHELELQRKELEETRKVFDKQSRIMRDQQNDNTFFNLLENHRQLVKSFTKGEIKVDGSGSIIGKNWRTYTDAVSGYEVLQQIADTWKNYFLEYSKGYRDKLIVNLDLQDYASIEDLMNSDPLTQTFTRELLHLHKFINKKFTSEDERIFYRETLSNSLTIHEKFIFEAMYELFPNYRGGVEYSPDYYQSHPYVDLLKCHLPEFKVKYNYDDGTGTKFKFSIQHYAHLLKSEFIIYENIQHTDLKIVDQFPIALQNQSENRVYETTLLDCLAKSKYSDWAKQPSRYLDHKCFAIHLCLEYEGNNFSLLIGIHHDTNPRPFYPNHPTSELINVGLKKFDRAFAKNLMNLVSK